MQRLSDPCGHGDVRRRGVRVDHGDAAAQLLRAVLIARRLRRLRSLRICLLPQVGCSEHHLSHWPRRLHAVDAAAWEPPAATFTISAPTTGTAAISTTSTASDPSAGTSTIGAAAVDAATISASAIDAATIVATAVGAAAISTTELPAARGANSALTHPSTQLSAHAAAAVASGARSRLLAAAPLASLAATPVPADPAAALAPRVRGEGGTLQPARLR